MDVVDLAIPGAKLIKPRRFDDERGFFQQNYHRAQYADAGIDVSFVQDNWSRSSRGVLRGLHYQFEHAQTKLVSVTRGQVFDVAVDMRKNSPTFGTWVGEILSEENGYQLLIPKGCAHGFYVMSDEVDFFYKCDAFYAPGDEFGVAWNDPALGIEWPLTMEPIISDKDKTLPRFSEAKHFDY